MKGIMTDCVFEFRVKHESAAQMGVSEDFSGTLTLEMI